MSYRNSIISTLTLALGLVALTGMTSTEPFAQATQSEASGFDALAYQVFGGAPAPLCPDQQSKPPVQ
ncbi:MAG: hypothetical protein V4582_19330 [Pseudomonadota bacterium]